MEKRTHSDSKRCPIIASSKTNNNQFKLNLNSNKPRSDAITELELIYEKLNIDLNDDQLLDRAERRDLPYRFQQLWHKDVDDSNDIEGQLNANEKYLTKNDLKIKTRDNNNNNSYESFNKRRSVATIEALVSLRNDNNNNHKSINSYKNDNLMVRSRTPPYRRSAIPDIVNDDFAFRKYNKSLSHSYLCSTKEIKGFNSIERINNNKNKSMSYLLIMSSNDNEIYCNNYNARNNSTNNDLKYLSKADIKMDDLSSRRMRQSDAANVLPPHPPFGIPNTIIPHSSTNDYIRAELDPKELNKTRFRCKSNVPHLIHDDMAFRSLRKDSLRKNMSTIKRATSVCSLQFHRD